MSNFVKIKKGFSKSTGAAVRITNNAATLNAHARDLLDAKRVVVYVSEDTAEVLLARTTADDPDGYRITPTGVVNCGALRNIARQHGRLNDKLPVTEHEDGILISLTPPANDHDQP